MDFQNFFFFLDGWKSSGEVYIGKGSAGGLESKTVGVATVLQATPHGKPHGAEVIEEDKDAQPSTK